MVKCLNLRLGIFYKNIYNYYALHLLYLQKQVMKKLLLVILFIGTTCHYTTAQTEVLADDYYKRGEYEKALITYRKLYDKKTIQL